jgi:hypothetical protein
MKFISSKRRYARAVKGDRVEIVVAADDGSRTYNVAATRAGRRVEVTSGRGIIEVTEVTRTGEPVRRARFMASRVLALVEHPASEGVATAASGSPPARAGETPAGGSGDGHPVGNAPPS